MTKLLDDLAEVVRLSEDATPGEWTAWDDVDGDYAKVEATSDGPNIANMGRLGWSEARENAAYVAALNNFIRTHHAAIADLAKELKVLRLKCSGSLANNRCPDHRDKQTGKPCLACENEKLAKRLEAAEKDAARYRWLCNANGYFMEEQGLCGYTNDKPEADQAIDAAMQETGR